jgi:hypothetical protein
MRESETERRRVMTKLAPVFHASTPPELPEGAEPWEYLLVPLQEAKGLKKDHGPYAPENLNELGAQGWEAVGLSLKYGDLMAWPVVLLKRPTN